MIDDRQVNVATLQPTSYRALLALSESAETAAADAGLDGLTVELVKLRTSQINGCAYCLRMHTREALAKGESPDRLAVLSAWPETGYFNDVERAALNLAEGVTDIAGHRRSGRAQQPTGGVLSREQTAAVVWLAKVMNAFNRVAISSQYRVAAD